MNDQPARPVRLTREQQRAARQHRKAYFAALKRGARGAGWSFAREQLFRKVGEWFVSVQSAPLPEQGARLRIVVKPMALDPLFWNIVGLDDNNRLPLSFRATGAWVLRPAWTEEHIETDEHDAERLAARVLDESRRRSSEIIATSSLSTMLHDLPESPDLVGQNLALAVCLTILSGDLVGATDLCVTNEADAASRFHAGGFVTAGEAGISTFVNQAVDWIARQRRDGLTAI